MFGQMLYAAYFTDECTKQPGNVIVSMHTSARSSSEMGNYTEKLQCIVYE